METGREEYFCTTCYCNTLGYYQNARCPICGDTMKIVEYVITQNKNGEKDIVRRTKNDLTH